MSKYYNRFRAGIHKFGAIRRTNGKSAWLKYKEDWYSEEYYKDLYNYYN